MNEMVGVDSAELRPKGRRREQQRSIDTRKAILAAALNEFAERGFDGASMRRIGERAGLDFTLITYHFRNKDTLWRAVAKSAFEELFIGWDTEAPPTVELSQEDRLKREFRAYFAFTAANPAFHGFMMSSMAGDKVRMQWLVDNFLHKLLERVRPQLVEVQQAGGTIAGNPNLLYYLMLGAASALYSLRGEIALTTGYNVENKEISEEFLDLFERAFFR